MSGCKESILHNLTEHDANRVLTSLGSRSIEASKVREADGTWAIEVDRPEAVAALRVLNEDRVLREPNRLGADKSSSFASREEQRYRYERALSTEIAHTIANIPGVLDARVHLNMPAVDPLFGQPLQGAKGSASVLVIAPAAAIKSEEVAALVSGASGIPAASVSILISAKAENEAPSLEAVKAPLSTEMPVIAPVEQDRTGYRGGLSHSFLIQVAVSLVIIGMAVMVMLVRTKRKKSAIAFEAYGA